MRIITLGVLEPDAMYDVDSVLPIGLGGKLLPVALDSSTMVVSRRSSPVQADILECLFGIGGQESGVARKAVRHFPSLQR